MSAARQPVQIRLSSDGLSRLDAVAADWECSRSDVIRAILSNALADRELLRKLKAARKEQI